MAGNILTDSDGTVNFSVSASIYMQGGMMMNVLSSCGGGEKNEENPREKQLIRIIERLQQTIDELKLNAHLEDKLESLEWKISEEQYNI